MWISGCYIDKIHIAEDFDIPRELCLRISEMLTAACLFFSLSSFMSKCKITLF